MIIYDIGGGFECDKPAFLAKLKRVVKLSKLPKANLNEIEQGCY